MNLFAVVQLHDQMLIFGYENPLADGLRGNERLQTNWANYWSAIKRIFIFVRCWVTHLCEAYQTVMVFNGQNVLWKSSWTGEKTFQIDPETRLRPIILLSSSRETHKMPFLNRGKNIVSASLIVLISRRMAMDSQNNRKSRYFAAFFSWRNQNKWANLHNFGGFLCVLSRSIEIGVIIGRMSLLNIFHFISARFREAFLLWMTIRVDNSFFLFP